MTTWGKPAPRRRWRDVLLCLVLVAVPVLFLRANLKSPQNLNFVDRGILKVTSPLQSGLTQLIRGLVGLWEGYVNLTQVKRENDLLRGENARLREDAARARREAAAAARYEELL
ncbi:MAG: hypothetical protein HY906_20215, partial [Deltaproteobacteria bacterium]|nr:hypothetical protein [Deltaproteobacteria bacterium]